MLPKAQNDVVDIIFMGDTFALGDQSSVFKADFSLKIAKEESIMNEVLESVMPLQSTLHYFSFALRMMISLSRKGIKSSTEIPRNNS